MLAVVGELLALPEPTRLRKLIDGQQLAFIVPVAVRSSRHVTRNATLLVDAVVRANGRLEKVVDLESRSVENAVLVLDKVAELTVVVGTGNAMPGHGCSFQLGRCECEDKREKKRTKLHNYLLGLSFHTLSIDDNWLD